MKKIFFGVQLMCAFIFTKADAQDVVSKAFYKEQYGAKIKDSTKAKFVQKNIIKEDGTLITEWTDLKRGEIINLELYKEGVPVGQWILSGSKLNCDSIYHQTISGDIPVYDMQQGTLNGEKEVGFESPYMGKKRIVVRTVYSIKYPQEAKKRNIKGISTAQFVVDENGILSQLSMFSSLHPLLDMELMRYVLQSGSWTPAKLNGKPIKVQVRYRFKFWIEEDALSY
jgi:hypothetical protein